MMVVESVILSRGRMNIETSSIEPQTMHEITEYVNESFNAMLFKNSSLDLLMYECVSSHRYCNCLRTLKEGLPDVDAAYRCRLFWVLPSNCLCDET
ncbi:hypothetical protein VAJ59_00005, partial [Klebsiella pneumoniae]